MRMRRAAAVPPALWISRYAPAVRRLIKVASPQDLACALYEEPLRRIDGGRAACWVVSL
jgi:hypothetical protein